MIKHNSLKLRSSTTIIIFFYDRISSLSVFFNKNIFVIVFVCQKLFLSVKKDESVHKECMFPNVFPSIQSAILLYFETDDQLS